MLGQAIETIGRVQSHYREVTRWEIFIEQELRLGMDLGRLALLKKHICADYEQLLSPFFSSFCGQKKIKLKNFLVRTLQCFKKKRPQKLPNRPKCSLNINSCSIKISHRPTSL